MIVANENIDRILGLVVLPIVGAEVLKNYIKCL